ncbi:MAG: polysaccharide deacetylase family protein [Clostridia bacterium]|nr:polysaccharide deacetylase family protein [Clostridia bacterium]
MRYRFLRFPDGKAKAVTLSYDDGTVNDITLSETLSAYSMKATFNLNGSAFRQEGYLKKEDVEKYILSNGHEVAIHGYFHRGNGMLRPIEGIREMLDCRLEMEKEYGRIIRGMAYPDMGVDLFTTPFTYEDVKSYLTSLDIVYARVWGHDNNAFMLPNDWHRWAPSLHHDNPDAQSYIDEFLRLDPNGNKQLLFRYPRLFYMWGHGVEFADNWGVLEDICKKLSGKSDIWYATNIEIYNYVEAYNSLIYSADGTIIYNPTLYDVFFDSDGKTYCVESGKTITIGGN